MGRVIGQFDENFLVWGVWFYLCVDDFLPIGRCPQCVPGSSSEGGETAQHPNAPAAADDEERDQYGAFLDADKEARRRAEAARASAVTEAQEARARAQEAERRAEQEELEAEQERQKRWRKQQHKEEQGGSELQLKMVV